MKSILSMHLFFLSTTLALYGFITPVVSGRGIGTVAIRNLTWLRDTYRNMPQENKMIVILAIPGLYTCYKLFLYAYSQYQVNVQLIHNRERKIGSLRNIVRHYRYARQKKMEAFIGLAEQFESPYRDQERHRIIAVRGSGCLGFVKEPADDMHSRTSSTDIVQYMCREQLRTHTPLLDVLGAIVTEYTVESSSKLTCIVHNSTFLLGRAYPTRFQADGTVVIGAYNSPRLFTCDLVHEIERNTLTAYPADIPRIDIDTWEKYQRLRFTPRLCAHWWMYPPGEPQYTIPETIFRTRYTGRSLNVQWILHTDASLRPIHISLQPRHIPPSSPRVQAALLVQARLRMKIQSTASVLMNILIAMGMGYYCVVHKKKLSGKTITIARAGIASYVLAATTRAYYGCSGRCTKRISL